MNIFEYFIERKRLNILDKELNSCNSRISKLTSNINCENPFAYNKIKEYNGQLQKETGYRDWLKEELKDNTIFDPKK